PVASWVPGEGAVAGHAVGNQAVTGRETAHMRRAMCARTVIDQAKGIIMHARGCGADVAFSALRDVAQRNRKKVVDVARELVAENTSDPERGTGPRPGPNGR